MQCEKCRYSENKMCGYGKKPKKSISFEVDESSIEMNMLHKLSMVLAEDNKCPFYEETMIPITWL